MAKWLIKRDLQTFRPNSGLLQWIWLQAFVDGSGSGQNIWKLFAIGHLASVYSFLTIPACLHIYVHFITLHVSPYCVVLVCSFFPCLSSSSFCSQTQYACIGWTDQSSWFGDSRSFGKGPTCISGMTSFLTWHAWYVRVLTNCLLIWHIASSTIPWRWLRIRMLWGFPMGGGFYAWNECNTLLEFVGSPTPGS